MQQSIDRFAQATVWALHLGSSAILMLPLLGKASAQLERMLGELIGSCSMVKVPINAGIRRVNIRFPIMNDILEHFSSGLISAAGRTSLLERPRSQNALITK